MRRGCVWKRAVILAGLAMLLPAAPDGALAQSGGKKPRPEEDAPIPTNKDLAGDSYGKAVAAEAAGDLETAYKEYRAALALHPELKTRAAFAQAAFKLGKTAEAAQLFRQILADPAVRRGLSFSALAGVKKSMTKAQESVGTLEIDGPAGADVWVGGALLGALPLKEAPFVDAGEREIEARRGATPIAKVVVSVTAGKSHPVKLVEGEGLPPPVSTATPAPSASGAPPVEPPPPSASAAAPAASSAPAPTSPPPDEPPPASGGGPLWTAVLTLGGAALAAGAIGGALWGVADSKGGEAAVQLTTLETKVGKGSPHCQMAQSDPLCSGIQSSLAAQDGLQTGAVVAWVSGGAAAIGAVAVYLLTAGGPPRAGLRLAPIAAPGRAGLLLHGSF